jgi:hypothetical protein
MIDVDELPPPRPHHYAFAHRWLPQFAQTSPERFFALFTSADGQNALESLWQAVGDSLEPEQRLSGEGLSVHWVALHPGRGALIIELPKPATVPEAYFVAVVKLDSAADDAPVPVFCLEFGLDFDSANGATVVGSWKEDEHVNHGPGPEPTLEAWTDWLRLLFTPLLN